MTDPIKSQYMSTKTGNYLINFIDSDGNKSNYERIEIVKCDKNFKKGDTYKFTGLNMIKEQCKISERDNDKWIFGKGDVDNHGKQREHNLVNLKRNGFDEQIDDKQLATYLNESFDKEKNKDNNTNFEKVGYAPSNTGVYGTRKKPDGTTEWYYTSTLFTQRKNPKED
jgi:hypothetical protein